jgi:endonuclease/exonuclease/phosphatase (EEP) superfamily protein YafD
LLVNNPYVRSFYRPTNDEPKPLEELDKALRKLTSKNSLPNIILGGDFNTPDINWNTN